MGFVYIWYVGGFCVVRCFLVSFTLMCFVSFVLCAELTQDGEVCLGRLGGWVFGLICCLRGTWF